MRCFNVFTVGLTVMVLTACSNTEDPTTSKKDPLVPSIPTNKDPILNKRNPQDIIRPQQKNHDKNGQPLSPSSNDDPTKKVKKSNKGDKGNKGKKLPDPIDTVKPVPLGIKAYNPAAVRSADFTIATLKAKAAIVGHPVVSQVVSRMTGNAGHLNGKVLEVVHGDIIKEKGGASFNAANGGLEGGGGVDGAYNRATKGKIYDECRAYKKKYNNNKSVPKGSAVITRAVSHLKVKFVVHVVGPSGAANQQNQNLLYTAILGGLYKASQHKAKSASIPAVSTGIFGFNLAKGVEIIVNAARDHFEQNPGSSLNKIRFVNIDIPGTVDQKTAKQFWDFFEGLKP